MTDAPRPDDGVEQLLALMARGVQRMADSIGSFERRLTAMAAESAATRPVWVDELVERIGILDTKIARGLTASADAPALAAPSPPAADPAALEAVRSMRDELVVSISDLRTALATTLERILTDQDARLGRLHDALASARAEPASTARMDEVQRILDELRDEVRAVHGEVVSSAGQLRADLAAEATVQRDRLIDAVRSTPIAEERFGAIERVLASLRDEVAIDRLESSLRDMAEDTSGLRADVRRSFDRVLHEISTTEESLKGEVRAIDHRLTGFGEDLRLVRGLRDSLEALAAGVDGVRQLAARSATSSQMGELAADLSTVLAEIETARAQVLSVDQQVGRMQTEAIDLPPSADVTRSVEELERTVTEEMADLGARIERIAERTVAAAPEDDALGRRLRSIATSARQLSMGINEDLKARRAKSKTKSKKR